MMANLRLTWKKAYHTAPHASNRTARGSYAGHKHSTSQKNTQNYGYAHHFRKVFLETLVIKPTQSRPPFPCSRKSQTSPCSAVFCFPCTNASCSALRPATARASNAMEGLTRNKTLLFLKKWMRKWMRKSAVFHHSARSQLQCAIGLERIRVEGHNHPAENSRARFQFAISRLLANETVTFVETN